MPLTYTHPFPVRFYECDYHGHLNQVNYVRYLAETAFHASAAAGFDSARYAAMERTWLIHDTEVEYLSQVRYGETLEVTTWVADFRHVRSRRMYEVRRAGPGDLVARGHTDWVFIDTATGRPAPIPPDLAAAFFPEGLPREPIRGEPFPAAPPAPSGAFSMRRSVEWRDLDPAQHVNNAVYFAYIEEAGVRVAEAFGWPLPRMLAAGFAPLARRHRVEYLLPAVFGDELVVTTWASDVGRASAVRHFFITRVPDGALLARAHTLWAWIDIHTGRPIRIPEPFLRDFAANIAPG